MIFLKKSPAILLGLSGIARGCGYRRSVRHELADVPGQVLQIAALLGKRATPIIDHRPVSWQDASGRDLREVIHCRQPPQDAAVEDGNVLRYDKVAGEQRAGLLVQNREIV